MENNWISVSEKLPLNAGYYLVWHENVTRKGTEIRKRHMISYFHEGDFVLSSKSKFIGVTHWMPLPEPPNQ